MKSRTMKSAVVALAAGVGVLGLSATANAGTASARDGRTIVLHTDDGTVTCRGGQAQWFANPGFSFTSGDQTNTINGNINLNQCISSKYPDLTSGDATFSATGKGVCPSGLSNGYGRGTVNWNNGKSSIVQGAFRATAGAFGFSDARVVSGLFQGGTATFAGHPTENWLACFWGIGSGEAIFDYATVNPTIASK